MSTDKLQQLEERLAQVEGILIANKLMEKPTPQATGKIIGAKQTGPFALQAEVDFEYACPICKHNHTVRASIATSYLQQPTLKYRSTCQTTMLPTDQVEVILKAS
jgi:hypothetical protein